MSIDILKEHLSTPDVAFCFFEYDLAIQLPINVGIRDARRSAWEGNRGSLQYHPRDISLAEPEYNPFAFDVACLGNMFLHHFTVSLSLSSLTLSSNNGLHRTLYRWCQH